MTDQSRELCELADRLVHDMATTPPALSDLEEAARQLRLMAEVVAERDELLEAIEELGYTDGNPAENVRRYKRYTKSEIQRLKEGSTKLKEYCRKLQDLLKPEQFMPIALDLVGKPVERGS